MNISEPITQLELFHAKAANEKEYCIVFWKKKKEIFEGMKFIGYSKEVEIRKSGRFANKGAAKGFVMTLKHMPTFTGEYEIIEYK